MGSFSCGVNFGVDAAGGGIIRLSSTSRILRNRKLGCKARRFPARAEINGPVNTFCLCEASNVFRDVSRMGTRMGGSKRLLRPGTRPNSVHFGSLSNGKDVSTNSGRCYNSNVPALRTGLGLSFNCGKFSLSVMLNDT